MSAAAGKSELELPALRQDLQLLAGDRVHHGAETWLIHDPVRHRYFQISARAVDLIGCWRPVAISAFRALAAQRTGREPGEDEVVELARFLFANNLTETPVDGNPASYAAQIRGQRRSPLMRAVHGYLFFRVPLVRPERFLAATLPVVAPLYTRRALIAVVALTLAGLYLTSRQWEAFVATFVSLLSFEGALLYGGALILVKTLHELGHAYTAARYGVRVNTMGVAFMLMMPLLYTDVSDAWRLGARWKKLAIDAAGVTVELAVAGIATFLWAFLADGPVRSAVFVLATTSWVLSLAVNLNPFMRFDGYYLASDGFRFANLQPRAFAVARWQIREWLFAIGAPPPEEFTATTRRALVAYGIATWVYRLMLFIGIALIVYHMFFKVLGVALFVVEIVWFIALPVWREVVEWWKLREEIVASRRTYITATIAVALIAVMAIPWSGRIVVPAVSWGESEVAVYPVRAARLESIHVRDGDAVTEGQVLAVLASEELDHKHAQAARRIALLRARLARVAGDALERADVTVLRSELEAAIAEHRGLAAERRRLTIRALASGVVRDLAPELHAGRHLKARDAIARLVVGAGRRARGYVDDDRSALLVAGAKGRFIPDDAWLPARAVTLVEIAPSAATRIEIAYLASAYGGAIASDVAPDGAIAARAGLRVVHFVMRGTGQAGAVQAGAVADGALNEAALKEGASVRRVQRGVIHVGGRPESVLAAAWRRVLKVLVREGGI